MINEMDQIQKSGSFAGKSELVRSAVRLLIDDSKDKDRLSGHMNAIVLVTHDESDETPVTKLKHQGDKTTEDELRAPKQISQNEIMLR